MLPDVASTTIENIFPFHFPKTPRRLRVSVWKVRYTQTLATISVRVSVARLVPTSDASVDCDSRLHPTSECLVAKIFDPVYFLDQDGYEKHPGLYVDFCLANETEAYDRLSNIQGTSHSFRNATAATSVRFRAKTGTSGCFFCSIFPEQIFPGSIHPSCHRSIVGSSWTRSSTRRVIFPVAA
jgi:hypothetical protein